MRVRGSLLLISIVALAAPGGAHATINLNPSDFSNPQALVSDDVVKPIVTAIGFAVDHRAYEGAVGLGTQPGIEFGVEATLVKLPNSFRDALSEAGMGSLPLPVLPVPNIIFHKGISDRVDLGFSALIFQQARIYGGDIKFVVYQPEEGPVWALRLNYTNSTLSYTDTTNSTLKITNTNWKPELLVSEKLDFTEGYLGVAYQTTRGTLSVNIPLPSPLPTLNASSSASEGAGLAFVGISLKVPNLGLRIVFDGEYSTVGADSLGAKVGFAF